MFLEYILYLPAATEVCDVPALSLFAKGAVIVYEYTWCFGIALAFPFEHCKYKFDFTSIGVKRSLCTPTFL